MSDSGLLPNASRVKLQLSRSQSVSSFAPPRCWLRQLVELPLNVEAADGLAVFQPHDPGARRVAGNIARALHGVAQAEIFGQTPIFEQRQDAGRGPNFQRGRKRTHVGIADEQMEPAVFPVIGQRLVARVDDGAIELHPLVDVVHDVVGALAELEIDVDLRLRELEIERERVRLPHPARAGENLARGEKGEQRAEHGRRELRLAFHQIILVAAKGRAGVVIDVVLDERNAVRRAERLEGRLQQLVARDVVGHHIAQSAGTPATRTRCGPCRDRGGRH